MERGRPTNVSRGKPKRRAYCLWLSSEEYSAAMERVREYRIEQGEEIKPNGIMQKEEYPIRNNGVIKPNRKNVVKDVTFQQAALVRPKSISKPAYQQEDTTDLFNINDGEFPDE